MTQNRWAPTLPTLGGRLATRVDLGVIKDDTYASKLEAYYLSRQSCQDIFVRSIPMKALKSMLSEYPELFPAGGKSKKLIELPGGARFTFLLKTLGHNNMSKNFQRKLSRLCTRGDIATIKRWWQTTDAVVLPLLLTAENPDSHYQDIDKLIKFSFENCANNYAQFLKRMKTLKKVIRKDFAEMKTSARSYTDVGTYWKVFKKHYPTDGADPHGEVRYILTWTQTRASGLADSTMQKWSLDKCENTLKTPRRESRVAPPEVREYAYRGLPPGEPELPREILQQVCWRVSDRLRGETAHVSAGPNSCLESTREMGGQTGYIKYLARSPNSLKRSFNLKDLTYERVSRRVTSQEDLVSWAVDTTLKHPTYVRCVRLHSVVEPSKARTITVCSLPYLIIVGVLAKLIQPAIASDITRGGLQSSRNLWNILFHDLDPNLGVWGSLRDMEPKGEPIMALSSDLSEATDYGDLGVARQLLDGLFQEFNKIPGFPIGLALLAKTLFIGKRFCLRHEPEGYRFFVKRNGWLMGDRLTKVILTLVHEIVVISSGLHTARICGDDIIAFSRDRKSLEKYFEEVVRLGFKVSEEDSYISSKLAFYCEEACIPFQRFRDLPAVCVRRKVQSCYVDYVRIRLLIPTALETKAYSYTDVGRFSLLGKESRWVQQNGLKKAYKYFHIAGLLQHLIVPEPSDTLCPYTPIEIGGDGAFPISHNFLKEVVLSRSRDFRETLFRMKQLLTSKWGYRFVRSPNLNEVVHKYHLLLPKIQELRALIPGDAIIEGNELLLGSIKVSGVETPERTFFRLWRAFYWHKIFQEGREPPKLDLGVDRKFYGPVTDVNFNIEDYYSFYLRWRETGFTFRNNPDYLIESSKVHVKDYMNMGWWFGRPPTRFDNRTSLQEIGGRKLLNEENIQSFLDHIKNDTDLDPKVKENLHKYVEADSYILWEYSRELETKFIGRPPEVILLVSQDKNLGAEIARMTRSRAFGRGDVILIPPMDYTIGLLDVYKEWLGDQIDYQGEVHTIVDFGAVNYAAFNTTGEFQWFEDPAVVLDLCYPAHPEISRGLGVWCAHLEERAESSNREVWSLTTQPADQIRPASFRR